MLPGDDRPDPRLTAFSTAPPALVEELDAYFRAGGVDNMHGLLRRIAGEIGRDSTVEPPRPLPRAFAWTPERGRSSAPRPPWRACAPDRALALLLVYRSAVLAGDTAPSRRSRRRSARAASAP